jgi:hypothetical protein
MMSERPGRVKVAVHGVPRSGTTWLAEILNSSPQTLFKYQPLFSYALKGYLGPDSSRERVDEFFALLESTRDDFLDRTPERARGTLPTFAKAEPTHVVYKEVRYHHILDNLMAVHPDVLLVACIRNPLSVVSSWLRAPREFRGDLGWKRHEEWRYAPKKNQGRPEEFHGYERWKDAAWTFLRLEALHPRRTRIVEYRRLLAHPEAEVAALFDFCGLPVTEQTRAFLRRSMAEGNPDAYSVFRSGQSDEAWVTNLEPEIAGEIRADIRGTDLERFVC